MSTGNAEGAGDSNNPSPSAQAQEEQILKSKYGGILPKKKPLISKDHERAFFDSADWALGKGAQKPKGPLEALRPKLQPTRQQSSRSRRSAYAPGNEEEGKLSRNTALFLIDYETTESLLAGFVNTVDGGEAAGEESNRPVEGGGAEEQSNHEQP
ncbi:hypothetical protein LINPERPRIM_LOCUS29063 [Linum perenne]